MDQAFRLSPQQRRLWKLQGEGQLSPYRAGCAVALAGELDTVTLREAVAAVAGRHEILRTVFRRLPDLEMPLQVVLPPGEVPLREVGLTGLDPAEQERRIGELLEEMAWTPEDLAAEPPLRLTLTALAPAWSVLVVGLPALCADRAGLRNLVREIAAAYAGTVPNEPPVQYADLSEWLNGMLEREDTREERERWGRPDPALHAVEGFSVSTVAVPLPEGGAWGRETAEPVLLLAAWSTLLARWTGSAEITVGTLFEGRSYEGLEEALGTFARVLPLSARIEPGEPFSTLLGRLDAAVRNAHERQEYFTWEEPDFLPFAFELEEELPSHPAGALTFLPLAAHAFARVDRFRLKLCGTTTGEQVRLELCYDPSAYERQEVERLAGQLATLIGSARETPDSPVSRLEILPEAERRQILELDAAAGPAARGFVHHLFAERARRAPDATAAVCRDASLTYAELETRANQLAHTLLRLGVSPGARVACCLPRGLEILAGLLGTLKAGAAFVPLDPQQPPERLMLMLEDLEAPVLLTTAELARNLPAAGARVLRLDADREEIGAASAAPPDVEVSEAGLAYVIFTSGSTGRPKGVAVEHRQLFNYVAGVIARLELPAGASYATVSTFAADLGHTMIFPALCSGGTLLVIEEEALTDPEALAATFARRPADCLKIVPSHLASLLAAASRPERLLPRQRLVLGGEACGPELIATMRRLAPPSCRIFNHYGPTETTVGVLTYPVPLGEDLAGPLPLGRPLPGTRVYVTDRHLRLVPFGMAGELCIGGASVSRGYLGRPDATAERFLPDPWDGAPGARLYRTGDLARRRPDGLVEFLGRCDDQVKLRGFRVEPGEIASQLLAHPAVAQAAVVLRADEGASEPRLVAYWVPARGAEADTGELRSFLESRLPAVMVPGAFVALAALPLTANGKLDRHALPAPERPYAAPRNTLEQTIAQVWQEVLGIERVGRDDNFFDVGGHSLLMIQVHARLRQRLGCDTTVVELFQYPTVRALAGRLRAESPLEVSQPVAAASGSGGTIAIVGLAGRFPGAGSVGELWANLRDGREAVVLLTDEEMRAAGVSPERLADPRYVKTGAVLADIDLFDAEFFGFSPREAEMMDPQHRLFLETSWQALEDAGYDPRGVPGGRVGVWAGSNLSTYAFHLLARPDLLQATGLWGAQHGLDKDFLPTRVSYELNLKGPSLAVQTGCSTSLVAVHAACRSLAAGECDMALAGGVHVQAAQKTGYLYEEGSILSPDGHCRAFDAKARGTFSGSGVGVVALKRLEDALRDGDTIRAVIRGTAVNNDGSRKVGFTAPGVDGQAEVIATALAAAGVPPASIGYVEAHGTGTSLGDPIEVAALTRAFCRAGGDEERRGFCGLGSIKSNIGHLGAASGVAGLIKTVLALEHRQIPPSLHFETPNPAIDFAASPFRVVDRLTDWETDRGPRRAGVSSFGIGGTNAHAVLEEAPPAEPSGTSRPLQLLLLSARTADALDEATARLASWLESHPEVPLADVAHTLQRGRHPFEHRRMLVSASREDALLTLRGHDPERLLARRRESEPPAVAWLLPGQGSQHPGMGRGLYDSEPVFRREVDACAKILAPRLGRDLREILFAGGADLAETRHAQPALFVVEHALARLWLSWGVRPQSLIGHSLGEYVAACLAGVLSLDDALALVAARGELMQGLPPGAMLSVDLPADRALAETAAAPGLALAAVNGLGQCVLSGPAVEIAALAARLAERAVPCRRLHTSHAFHSPMMEPILDRFSEILAGIELRPPSLPYVSNLTGTWITADEATSPRYWVRHLRETVRFGDGLSCLLAELPPGAVLLEVGPGRALGRLVRGQATGRTVLSSMPHPGNAEPGAAALLHAVGRLWLAGAEIDWQAFEGEERRRRVPLPTYPFQRRRYWVEAPPGQTGPLAWNAPPVVFLMPDGAAADPDWIAGLEARGARVVALRPEQARREALDDLFAEIRRPAAAPTPREETAAGHDRPGIDTPYQEPATATERRLARIWGTLLGIDRVGVHDDFFELGGHSLLATRLVSRIREELGGEIALETVFAEPTIARFAVRLEAAGKLTAPALSSIEPVPREGPLPPSFAQERLIFLHVLAPGDTSYNIPFALRLHGPLEIRRLRGALRALVARHETLRTNFALVDEKPVQVIAPGNGIELPLLDLSGLPQALALEEAARGAAEETSQPFDLFRGPVLRTALLRLRPTEHVLLVSIHHIAVDGWSWGVFFREMADFYERGETANLCRLPAQYADFAFWQRRFLQGDTLEKLAEYWTHRLFAAPPLFELPSARPRSAAPLRRGAESTRLIPPLLAGEIQALSRRESATLFMVLLAAFKALLHARTGRTDLVVGTDVAGRNRAELEGLIGFFINQLVLRTDLSGNPSFREVIARARETALGAYAHQDMPFHQLVNLVAGPRRSADEVPLFQVKLVLQNAPAPAIELPGLTLEPFPLAAGTAQIDLNLRAWETPRGLVTSLHYRADLYDAATAALLLEHFEEVLRVAVARPEVRLHELAELLDEKGRHQRNERDRDLRSAGREMLQGVRRKATLGGSR